MVKIRTRIDNSSLNVEDTRTIRYMSFNIAFIILDPFQNFTAQKASGHFWTRQVKGL